ncbi:MAG: tripartite tricarboxylate transporter permease [Deltaproteobacteria bacterium]|nr:tripartite tricarboxylate transporter permease [Deltaproteobacteria bacterium]
MWEAALTAVENIFGCPCVAEVIPRSLVFLVLGVLMGLSLGAIPGLGGLVGLAILLPFTLDLDTLSAFAVMIGLISVTTTSDTIPSVLFGVPGTAASQATILDGHPMAKKGEAGRAFGAAYMASMMGGLFGALILAVSIPVLRPIVLAFSAPEFFMMGMLGISMVAVLSGGAPLKGLVVGALGLMVGMVGMDYQVGEMRWTFGQLYLWEGVPLVPVALGIFAIPEMVDLVIRGTRIADVPRDALRGVTVGIRDAFRHWFLVLRSSAVGVWVGATPGLGGAVVDWFAYGHAVQTERGARDSFGTGDVRGVIAPESANNAKEGGSLIPTLAFGVPGSAAMAILLGVFLIQGISPGPDMLTKHLDVTYTMVWSIAIANIFGTGLCLLLTNHLARLANVRVHLLAPLVIVVVFLAAFQAKRHFGDLILLLSFGFLGWLMKRFGWPRPPLILGLVLSSVLENYFFIAASHYGVSWLWRPIVLVIGALIVASLVYGQRWTRTGMPEDEPAPTAARWRFRFHLSLPAVFSLAILVLVLSGVVTARGWPDQARLFPLVVGLSAAGMCAAQLFLDLFRVSEGGSARIMDLEAERGVPGQLIARRAADIFGWILGLLASIWVIGFLLSVPLFMWLYLALRARAGWRLSFGYTALALAVLLGVFHYTLHIPWPQGVVAGPQEVLLQWLGG